MAKRVSPYVYLFDIPIYWCKEKSFNQRYQDKLNQDEETEKTQLGKHSIIYEPTENDRRISHNIRWEELKGPWRFNQIVGWVRIHRFGYQLRGEFWSIKSKRFGWQVTKKRFSLNGKAFEIHPREKETSKQIFRRMYRSLRAFEGELQGRVLDLEGFEKLGRFIDWRQLIDTHNV